MSFVDDLGLGTLRDWMGAALGKRLGDGMQRKVFVYDLNPSFVIKVEDGAQSFQNVLEWTIWNRVRETPFARWFAPCMHISPSGSLLLMKRTLQPRRRDYPKLMPAFLTDFKRENFGMIGGRLVCHDYGVNLLIENGLTKKMRKADWWDLNDGRSFESAANS